MRLGRRRLALSLAVAGAAAGAAVLLLRAPERPRSSQGPAPRARGNAAQRPDPSIRRRVLLGRSVDGRPIYALELGDPDNEKRTLAVMTAARQSR